MFYVVLPGGKKGNKLPSGPPVDSTRSSGIKLHRGEVRLDIRKHFFRVAIVKYWNTLPQEGVESVLLEIFKKTLEKYLAEML